MNLIYIYLGISLLTFILFKLTACDIAKRFKTKYPNLKYPTITSAGKIAGFIKTLVGSFIPIVNVGLLWVLIFQSSEFEKRVVADLLSKCTEVKE